MLHTLLFENYLVFTPLLAYLITQILKTLLYFLMTKKFDWRRLLGSGGMPSSHSATVTALFVAALKKCGAASPITAAILIFAIIVVYDAMGVRQETGKHAQLLNKLLRREPNEEDSAIQLNEMVGHTSFQVMVGVVLGAVVAVLIPAF